MPLPRLGRVFGCDKEVVRGVFAFLERRRRDVEEWFVVLDKAMAMRDWDAARSQAKWIIDHATLTGERIDARRASDALAKIPEEDK